MDFLKLVCGPVDLIFLQSGFPLGWRPELGLVQGLCQRRHGIGATGLFLLIEKNTLPLEYELLGYRSDGSPLNQPFEFLISASRYLFDSGRFGAKPIRIEAAGQVWLIEAVDSRNFRVKLTWPTDGPEVRYQPAPDWYHLRKLSRQLQASDHSPFAPTMFSADSRHQVSAFTDPRSTQRALCATWCAREAWKAGLTADDILVNLNGSPYFVEIEAGGLSGQLTAGAEYVFSGTWSINDDWNTRG